MTTTKVSPQTFEYNGHTIALTRSGKFATTKDDKTIMAGSLAGIKKKIDAKPEFEPFNGLRIRYYEGEVETVRVVGRQKQRGKYAQPAFHWVLDNGSTIAEVYEDTADNRALFEQQKALRAEHERAKDAFQAADRALSAKMTRRKAAD